MNYYDWYSIYDYYYNLSINNGDGEEYARAYARTQADLQVIK